MNKLTLSSKNQVVIPKAVRHKLKVGSGDTLIVKRLTDTEVVLKKQPGYRELIGKLPTQLTEPEARVRQLRDNWR